MDPYSVLGVAPTAREDEVRAAYRARSRLLHPDVHRDASGRSPQAAHEAFTQLCDAYRLALSGLDAATRVSGTRRPEPQPEPRPRPRPRVRERRPETPARRQLPAPSGEGSLARDTGREVLTWGGLAVLGWLVVSDFVPALVQYAGP
jgi:hypothetical protein